MSRHNRSLSEQHSIGQWYRNAYRTAAQRPSMANSDIPKAGLGLKLVEESLEVCMAMGISEREMRRCVARCFEKERAKLGRLNHHYDQNVVQSEMCDVEIVLRALMGLVDFGTLKLQRVIQAKMRMNHNRTWRVNEFGGLSHMIGSRDAHEPPMMPVSEDLRTDDEVAP